MLLEKGRRCEALNQRNEPCGQALLTDNKRCMWHAPEYAEEALEARSLGGRRRRREHVIKGSFELSGLSDVASVRRGLEVALTDTLELENSNPRSLTFIQVARAAADLLKTGELEQRIIALEAVTNTNGRL